jgi:hypothetical protein
MLLPDIFLGPHKLREKLMRPRALREKNIMPSSVRPLKICLHTKIEAALSGQVDQKKSNSPVFKDVLSIASKLILKTPSAMTV